MKRFVFVSFLLGILHPGLNGFGAPQRPPLDSAAKPQAVASVFPKAYLSMVVSPSHTTVIHFSTLPVGSQLPGDAECSAAVRSAAENKGMNARYNATRGSKRLASNFFTSGDPRANTEIAARVTGNFVGTTDEIIQWAACKWGIDEDIVRAQASRESWWRQTTLGDWTTDASRCAPGHGLGADGRAGQCPGSWGVLQVSYRYYGSGWPDILNSTAFNIDTAYAIWRACFEGYEWWLNNVTHVGQYGAGDLWGCVGRWNTGKWHIPDAEDYIGEVKSRLNSRFWEQPVFQEP